LLIDNPIELGPDSSWEASQRSEIDAEATKPVIAELSSPPPLSSEEYAELERRRQAVELQARSVGVVRMAEQEGQLNPRAELEALRANARAVYELGGHSIFV
jgi:hypothetical protein